ncbi:endonuclease domain-containing protein [Bellilinea sp.]|jgi:very-short-patch-repair endonuclease|uniref:endonuclease domain-containing protein n=1 Tax=Bellilinea sp. TaxID=2838785 RepID=UPI002ADD569B|nr:endonuclease domain-containing protein [Bellilinea sp.]
MPRTPSLTRQRAKTLRKNLTPAERRLWAHLRAHRFFGVHFRAQHPIGNFIVDFCAPRRRLVIEVDGGQHLEQESEDGRRTRALQAQGYRVLRFWNHQIENELPAVLEAIRLALEDEQTAA